MQSGFIFCGIDISDLGLTYAPELENTYVYHPSEWEPIEESIESYDGGYYYGTQTKPKDFVLRCFFEEKDIRQGIMTRVNNLFRRGNSGRLVFKQRPWIYYNATVVAFDPSGLTNYLNGTMTVTLRAYYPFGRTTLTSVPEDTEEEWSVHDDVVANSAILPAGTAAPPTSFTNVTGEKFSCVLYNGGTEMAKVAIRLKGTVDGLIITNKTTNQKCRFVAMNTGDKTLVHDGLNDKTYLTDGIHSEHAFLYHDYGNIELAPAYPISRDIVAEATAGSNIVTIHGKIPEMIYDKFIYINGGWKRITGMHSASKILVNATLTASETVTTNIVKMNDIELVADTTMNLSQVDFIFQSTFA